MKDIQRQIEKGRERCMMGGWYKCLAEGWEGSQPHTHITYLDASMSPHKTHA